MIPIPIVLVLLSSLFVFASVDTPGSISLIRPKPNTNVTQYTNLTYGVSSSNKQYWGLVENVVMWYTAPDGTQTPSPTYGPAITSGGVFQDSGYTPEECRSYPGTTSLNVVNASETGNYTFFWNVTYVESSDPTQANSTYCGPPPFSQQSWLLNSTVEVVEADFGTAVVGATSTTMQGLPSKPTGKVNSADVANVLGKRSVAVMGLLLGLGLSA